MPIESACCDQEECQKKIADLEATIEDLKSESCTLIDSAEELKNEAYNRVQVMQELLQRTAQAAKASMVKLNDYEQIARSALSEKIKLLSEVKKLQDHCLYLEDRKQHHQGVSNNLMHDVTSLVKLITHAQKTGQWNVGSLDFCELTFEQVFGSVERLSHWSADDSSGAAPSLMESMSESQLREDGVLRRQTSASGMQVFQLQLELRQMQKLFGSTQAQLSDRDRMIADLQTQITDLNHEISLKETGCFIHQQMMHKVHENGRCLLDPNEESFAVQKGHLTQNGFHALVDNHDNFQSSESPILCKEDTHAMIIKLQEDNARLMEELDQRQVKLQSCNEELESILKNNLRLEQEVALTDNLWQELETYKEDKENLLLRVAKKNRRIQELEGQPPCHSSVPSTTCCVQTDLSGEQKELERLTELEQRHQRKAAGLEVVVQLLQTQLSEKDNEANELQAQVQKLCQGCEVLENETRLLREQLANLENKLLQSETTTGQDSMISTLNEQISSLTSELQITLKVLASKDGEIEYQKQTISNLRDALVSLKASPNGNNYTPLANGQVDQKTKNQPNSHLSQRSISKSREIFDI